MSSTQNGRLGAGYTLSQPDFSRGAGSSSSHLPQPSSGQGLQSGFIPSQGSAGSIPTLHNMALNQSGQYTSTGGHAHSQQRQQQLQAQSQHSNPSLPHSIDPRLQHQNSYEDQYSNTQHHHYQDQAIPDDEADDEDQNSDRDLEDQNHNPNQNDPYSGTGSKKRKFSLTDPDGKQGDDRGGGQGGTKEKKRRQVQSCSECRRRKIKCDKKFPCGPCTSRNDQGLCREVEKHTPTTTGCASMNDLTALQYRLSVLETLLAESGIISPGTIDDLIANIQSKPKPATNQPVVGTSLTAAGVPKVDSSAGGPTQGGALAYGASTDRQRDAEVDSDTEGAALTLEHLAFGQRKTEQQAPALLSGRSLSGTGQSAMITSPVKISGGSGSGRRDSGMAEDHVDLKLNGSKKAGYKTSMDATGTGFNVASTSLNRGLTHNNMSKAGRGQAYHNASDQFSSAKMSGLVTSTILDSMDPAEVFSIFYQRSDVYVRALLSVIPTREQGELLVKQYLDRVEWLHRCLHVPTFLNQCQELWDTPQETIVQEVYTPFLSLYLTILCLGLYFMDPKEALQHFTQEQRDTLPEKWLNAAHGSLWQSDFMAVHTIEHLQTMTLMGIFLNTRDRADAAWSMLGAAIKMAQGMGLSRLGGEPKVEPGEEPLVWKAPWESLIKREVGRRLWWNLVFMDWSLAPSYNFSSSIQPDQIKTALPANVNDADIVDGQPLRPKPLSERTELSYHLSRLRFAEISQRQIWQANASPHPPYSFILSVDNDLRKAIADLPEFFSCDFDNLEPPPQDPRLTVFYWEKIIINLSGQSRLMRLHRPWLSRGYKDRKYEYSRQQCIQAARNCLKLMSDDFGTAVFLERWWMPLFYVTVAAVVVLIDLLRTPINDLETGEAVIKRTEVVKAVDRISQIADMSHSARGSVKVITQLLVELEEKRTGAITSPMDGPDASGVTNATTGLHRVVKKLIIDASTKAGATSPTDIPGSGTSQISMTSPGTPLQPISFRKPYVPEPTVRDDRAAMDLAYGNLGDLFDWDSSQTPRYGGFPMEISGATNLGMNQNMAVNFDNIELENMLASFMPSRPPSPHQTGNPEFSTRMNEFNGDPSHAVWPSVERPHDMPNAFGTPYNGWMG